MIHYTGAQGDNDLQQILELQRANLANAIAPEEALEQGFVTVTHDFSTLQKMNKPYPHTVAKAGDQVIGYALTMTEDCQDLIPILVPFFKRMHHLSWNNRLITTYRFVLMGQVCVAKDHRGQGIFAGLYRTMQKRMAPHFELIVTEISVRNTRSLRAHEKVGFQQVDRFTAPDGEVWIVVVLKC